MKLEIPAEVAHGIAVASMKDWRAYLKKELAQHKKNPKSESNPGGYWLHPDDVILNQKYIEAMDLLIPAFGG